MNSIFSAMLKDRPELNLNASVLVLPPPEGTADTAANIARLKSRYLGTAAICAVLNGGYGAIAAPASVAAPRPQPLTPQDHRLRQAGGWLALLAVSGLIGLVFGHHGAPERPAAAAQKAVEARKSVVIAQGAAAVIALPGPAALSSSQTLPAPGAKASAPAAPVNNAKSGSHEMSSPAGTTRLQPSTLVLGSGQTTVPSPVRTAENSLKPPTSAPAEVKPTQLASAHNAPATTQLASLAPSPHRIALKPLAKAKPAVAAAPAAQPAEAEVARIAPPAAPKPALVADNRPGPATPGAAEVLYEAEPGPSVKPAQADAAEIDDAAAAPAAKKTAKAARRASSVTIKDDAEPAGGAALRVEGIFWDRKRPMALVGGSIVEPGSHIGAIEVVEIREDGVVISEGGQRRVLHP